MESSSKAFYAIRVLFNMKPLFYVCHNPEGSFQNKDKYTSIKVLEKTAVPKFFVFFKIFCRTQVLFVGPLIPLFWTSGDVCPGFQSQGGFPCLHASLPPHNGFLRFTSSVTPAFSTNSGVHCISVYTAWLARLLSHALGFEPPTQW